MIKTKLVEIFYVVDEFCKESQAFIDKKSLHSDNKAHRNRKPRMSDSEVMTILIVFHLSRMRDLKSFYLGYIAHHCKEEFPKQLSYNRFVERQTSVGVYLLLFLNLRCLSPCTGISFIDSTPIRACELKRAKRHKSLKMGAEYGFSSMGCFYGFKLHIIINDKGELLDFRLTPANTDDRLPLYDKSFTDKLYGKLVADKGYISQGLFEHLFIDDIHLVTRKKKNMKNSLMLLTDKILLRKRVLVECVNDELKNVCQIEHTRHRSIHNFMVNLIAGLIAYQTLEKKTSLNLEHIDSELVSA